MSSESNHEISPEDQAMYQRYENACEALVSAFTWAMNEPDTVQYGEWSQLTEEQQELVVIEIVEELYSYACGELDISTDLVDDCLTEASE